MQIDDLIDRVQGLTEPDREVDREIGLAIGGWWLTTDQWGDAIMVDGDRYPDHPGSMYPALTESLDAAVSLVERVLPGWGWDAASGTEHIKACLNPEYGGPIGRHPHWAAVANSSRKQFYDGATPAIALILALLSALKAKEARDGR